MFVFVLLMLPLCGMALVQERYARVSVIRLKRQTASCDQMYGPGAEPCGGEGSNYCFNPTVGQVSGHPQVAEALRMMLTKKLVVLRNRQGILRHWKVLRACCWLLLPRGTYLIFPARKF